MKALTDNGIGHCLESGAGCSLMEFCFKVADEARGRVAFQSRLEAHFPGRGFGFYARKSKTPDNPPLHWTAAAERLL